MGILLVTAPRNAACNALVGLVNSGSAAAAGVLKIGTSASMATVLAELTMANPAFGAAASGVATANAITDETSAPASGTASHFAIYDRDDTKLWTGTVTATGGGGDIELSSTTITAGDTVQITALTATMGAGAL